MRHGLTLIEILVAVSIAAIVITVGVIAMNPAGQLAAARNSERTSHLNTIMNAIRENVSDKRTGVFTCAAGDLPTSTKRMAIGAGNYDIAGCLIPTYLYTLPFDPSTSSAHYTSNTDYDTGYYVSMNSSTKQVTLTAPAAELNKTISIMR